MTEYDETNRGAIWRNTDKKTDKHPDFSGSLNVEGVEYFLDGWQRAKDANPKAPAVRFSIKRKEKQSTGGTDKPKDDFEDSALPFIRAAGSWDKA